MAIVFKKKEVNVDVNKVLGEIEKAKILDVEQSIRQNMIRVINWMLDHGHQRKAIMQVLSEIFVDNSKNYFNTVLYEVKKLRREQG